MRAASETSVRKIGEEGAHALLRLQFALPSMQRERPWARLFGGSPARIPILQRRPDMFAGVLGLLAQLVEIDAGNHAVFHADVAVDDDGVDIVADAALDQALDGIADRPIAQRFRP